MYSVDCHLSWNRIVISQGIELFVNYQDIWLSTVRVYIHHLLVYRVGCHLLGYRISSVRVKSCHLTGYRAVTSQGIGLLSVRVYGCHMSGYSVVICQGINLSTVSL